MMLDAYSSASSATAATAERTSAAGGAGGGGAALPDSSSSSSNSSNSSKHDNMWCFATHTSNGTSGTAAAVEGAADRAEAAAAGPVVVKGFERNSCGSSHSAREHFVGVLKVWCQTSEQQLQPEQGMEGKQQEHFSTRTSGTRDLEGCGAGFNIKAPLLLFDKEVPELSGFARFLGAALGCYDDGHGQLHDLLLTCSLKVLEEQGGPAPAGRKE